MAPSRAITTALRGPAEPKRRAPGRSGPIASTHPSSSTVARRVRRPRRVVLACIRPGRFGSVPPGFTHRFLPILATPETTRTARPVPMPTGTGHGSEHVEYGPALAGCNAPRGGETRYGI